MKKLVIFAAVMVVGAGAALTSSLSVPFFVDTSSDATGNGGTGIIGLIGIRNLDSNPQVITVVYSSTTASGIMSQSVTASLPGDTSIDFQPVQSTGFEGPGSIVPNMTLEDKPGKTSIAGGATILAPGPIAGRYRQIDRNNDSELAFVLLNTTP